MFQFLLPTIASTALGVNKANRQAAQQKAHNLGQAEVTRYSPWTGQSGQLDTSYAPSALEGGFSGAVQGLGIGQAIDKAFMQPANPVAGLDAGQRKVYDGIAQKQPMNKWEMLAGQPMQPNMYNGRGMFG